MSDALFFLHHGGDSHHTVVNQKPHDAADAARLYSELRDKVVKEITDFEVQKFPGIEAKFMQYALMPPTGLEREFWLAFTINGKIVKTKISVDEFKDSDARIKKMVEAVAIAILEQAISVTEMKV